MLSHIKFVFKSLIIILAFLVLGLTPIKYCHSDINSAIDKVLSSGHRSNTNKARDKFRNPKQTLKFFGLRENLSVLEITPGRGWYTEILAPLMKSKGTLYVANYDLRDNLTPNKQFSERYLSLLKRVDDTYRDKLAKNPSLYSTINYVTFNPKNPVFDLNEIVDLVLTFRNVHNWASAGTTQVIFESFFNSLKSGGVLGIVEHRAKPKTALKKQLKSGYMTEQYVIDIAKKVGFVFVARSEINKNPEDTTNHPRGVWTLLPIQRGLSEGKKIEYGKIGESDRMTLKFTKP